MSFMRVRHTLLLLLLVMVITGCQHIGINESNSLFIGRYTEYIQGNMPQQYANLNNPYPASTENIADGKRLYQAQCQTCHGEFGQGDGLVGEQLMPRPANLSLTRRLPVTTDAFFFWTLSEGGQSLGTAMPAFSSRLSEKEMWQVIRYINTGFSYDQGASKS